jgi:hypothetical protein
LIRTVPRVAIKVSDLDRADSNIARRHLGTPHPARRAPSRSLTQVARFNNLPRMKCPKRWLELGDAIAVLKTTPSQI